MPELSQGPSVDYLSGLPPIGRTSLALSMTGFGAAEGDVAGCRVRVELRTVNHRFFHCTVRLPGEFAAREADVRKILKARIARGHATLSMGVQLTDAESEGMLDTARATKAHEELSALGRHLGLEHQVNLDTLIRFPEVVTGRKRELPSMEWESLAPLVESAVAECLAMRSLEGAVLSSEILDRIAAIEATASQVSGLLPGRLGREMVRLRKNVGDLVANLAVDDERLAQELAIAADRLDVTEEMVRLDAHLKAAKGALAGKQPVGKQLGFLAQEMGREINTIGSKANDASIAHLVVSMKGDLEQIREQLENLE